MANIVTLTATDGSSVEFYDEIKASGGVKDVYFSTDGTYVVAFYRKALSPNDRQRIDDIVNTHRQLIFTTDEVGKYWTTLFAWPTKIVMWGEKVGLVMPFYDKKFFFSGVDPTWRYIKNGQEKNGKWFSAAKLVNRYVPANQKGTFLTRLRMCLQIARAMRRLHAAGLAHSDLSYNNVLVDPVGGNACIIDCDGLVVPQEVPPRSRWYSRLHSPRSDGYAGSAPRRSEEKSPADFHRSARFSGTHLHLLAQSPSTQWRQSLGS